MALLLHAKEWIERTWREMGSSFTAHDIPVAQFVLLNVDDLSFPFKNQPIETWRLAAGRLLNDPTTKLSRVPYVAFSLDEQNSKMHVQVQWAPRCGYGYIVIFGLSGQVANQDMRWVS